MAEAALHTVQCPDFQEFPSPLVLSAVSQAAGMCVWVLMCMKALWVWVLFVFYFFFYWGGGKENFMWNARVILLCKAGFLSGAED